MEQAKRLIEILENEIVVAQKKEALYKDAVLRQGSGSHREALVNK